MQELPIRLLWVGEVFQKGPCWIFGPWTGTVERWWRLWVRTLGRCLVLSQQVLGGDSVSLEYFSVSLSLPGHEVSSSALLPDPCRCTQPITRGLKCISPVCKAMTQNENPSQILSYTSLSWGKGDQPYSVGTFPVIFHWLHLIPGSLRNVKSIFLSV